jgi:tetratricopeptide (TPR) repeat protein
VVAVLVAAFAMFAKALPRDDAGDVIKRAKKDMEARRFVAADSGFARAALMAQGEERAEALFLRASVVQSGLEAESLYRAIVDEFMESEYGRPAALELAKIQFAMGRYEGARDVLRTNDLCAWSDEACVFDGMAGVMIRNYDEAALSLQRVRRGRDKTWATIALAEAEEGMGNIAAACERYASLARARVHPTAWLRHAECRRPHQRHRPQRLKVLPAHRRASPRWAAPASRSSSARLRIAPTPSSWRPRSRRRTPRFGSTASWSTTARCFASATASTRRARKRSPPARPWRASSTNATP